MLLRTSPESMYLTKAVCSSLKTSLRRLYLWAISDLADWRRIAVSRLSFPEATASVDDAVVIATTVAQIIDYR